MTAVLARKMAGESLVRDVAPAAAWVAEHADHVKIHAEKVPAYAEFILSKYPLVTTLDNHHYVSTDAEETAAYILALDSINFGSGYFYPGFDYNDVAGGLKKAFERGELNTPERWVAVTAEDFSRILSVKNLDGLMELYAHHLRETGRIILSEYDGKILNFLRAADYSAVRLADTVSAWETFHDVHIYKGREVPILKRAQILAADMNLALGGFSDLEGLTIFADNRVPHVLRCDGILDYAGGDLASGSPEEIEIRACAIHAVELMRQSAGGRVTAANLDHLLWHRGHEPGQDTRCPHKTQTTDY